MQKPAHGKAPHKEDGTRTCPISDRVIYVKPLPAFNKTAAALPPIPIHPPNNKVPSKITKTTPLPPIVRSARTCVAEVKKKAVALTPIPNNPITTTRPPNNKVDSNTKKTALLLSIVRSARTCTAEVMVEGEDGIATFDIPKKHEQNPGKRVSRISTSRGSMVKEVPTPKKSKQAFIAENLKLPTSCQREPELSNMWLRVNQVQAKTGCQDGQRQDYVRQEPS